MKNQWKKFSSIKLTVEYYWAYSMSPENDNKIFEEEILAHV